MTNAEGMTKPETRWDCAIWSFVIRSLFRHSSFVIRHSAAVALRALATAFLLFGHTAFAVEALQEIVEQKYSVEPNATLSISNTDGSIRVYGSNDAAISIQAIKKAYTAERLKGIVVDVKATGKDIAINTTFPPRKNAVSDRSGTVDYILIVPQTIKITRLDLTNGEVLIEGLRGGSATSHLLNGWVAARNCFGNLDLSIVNGRLDVGHDWWETHAFSVKASSANANLRLFLPSDASARISARATTGRIFNAFDPKKPRPNENVRTLDTVTGSNAEAAFEMKATSGNIRIEKTN
jgi:hypothetical protein